jgi:hypothetical protein
MDSQMPQSRWRNRKYPWDYYKILVKISGEGTFGAPDPTCAMVKKQLAWSSRRTPGRRGDEAVRYFTSPISR